MAHINQVELIGRILIELDRQGAKTINQQQMNKIILAADRIVESMKEHDPVYDGSEA